MRIFGSILLTVSLLGAQTLPQSQAETLARAARQQPSAANLAALSAYALEHRSDTAGALALLALGTLTRNAEAIAHYDRARPRLAPIADYILFLTAREQFNASDFGNAARSISQLIGAHPLSPMLPRALVLGARAQWRAGDADGALRLLETNRQRLPPAAGDLLEGQIAEDRGLTVRAIQAYRRACFAAPKGPENDEAEKALARLNAPLGTPAERLKRAIRLTELNDAGRALREITAVLPELPADQRELGALELAVAEYHTRANTAYARLKSLTLTEPDLDAKRLHYLLQAARRLGKHAELIEIADELRQKHPTSVWRLQSLILAGDHFYQQNDPRHEGVFDSCAAAFPQNAQAAYCHWKSIFRDYLDRRVSARDDLLEHLRRFPASPHASAALYFLGRLAETARDWPAARAYYQRATRSYPNHFYASLARTRLAEDTLAAAGPVPATLASLLERIAWPAAPARPSFEFNAANRSRRDRANLLAQAAIDDLAELELRSGAGEQPHVTAMLLAQLAQRRGEPEKGVRWIKSLFPAYFSLALEDAPFEFWQLAYPLPWRSKVESLAKEHALDPYLIAGLIRQESEFDAEAVSRSNARGLTQVMPATGYDLSRRIGLRGYHTGLLFSPDVNLKLGTFYMRWLLNLVDNTTEFMLASYNGGKTRVDRWREVYRHAEPAELVESIPLSETRNYVQIVMRNADFYRRLYAGRPDAFTPTPEPKPLPPAPRAAAGPARKQVPSKNGKVVRPARRPQ